MGNKTRPKLKKLKNRGGEKLNEWRILREFGVSGSTSKLVSSGKDGDNVSAVPGMNCSSNLGCTPLYNSDGIEREYNYASNLSDCSENGGIDCNITSVVEQQNSYEISGRRIVDIAHVIKQFKEVGNHAPQFGCSFVNMDLISERKRGLRSGFLFKCNMCGVKKTVWSEDDNPHVMDINSAAVAGVMSSGGGFANLEKILGAMNIRCMNHNTFDKHDRAIAKGWEQSALEEMRLAAEEEKTLATERGDVDRDGVPLLTVVADGSWAKRSYRTTYNSLSGVGAIVGYYTKKVLYFGVKNRYCVTCCRASNEKKDAKAHLCFKNWSGSASSMESAIIVEGFLSSLGMYGVKYAKIIADGDCSVYHDILAARPYDNLTVVKVECRNHLLRNFCNKLKEITTTSVRNEDPDFNRSMHLKLRRVVGGSIMRCRNAVTKAVAHRKSESDTQANLSVELKKDIINAPSHIFGEHLRCAELGYFCKGPREDETNHIPDMKKVGIYQKVMEAVNTLADNSQHLIQDMDSNIVEQYNAIVAKFTGGKRINFVQKGSYQARCAAAVVNHNSGKSLYKLHKTILKSSPAMYSKLYEERSKRKVTLAAKRNLAKPKAKRKLIVQSQNDDKYYGPSAQKPDIEQDLFDTKVNELFQKLKKTEKEIQELEENTRDQFENQLWFEERRLRLTASNFGSVCNRKPYTKCSALVRKLLYSAEIDTTATRYGKMHEKTAIQELVEKHKLNVSKCGLFVDKDLPFLAASPDGVIDDGEGIVEVKCPATGVHKTPDELIEKKLGLVGNMWTTTGGTLKVKQMHNYHLQVQGQLNITGRKYCLFTIWTPQGLRVETIWKDEKLWEEIMKPKLDLFYKTCLLPELIDPRQKRHMPLREPEHIVTAIENKRKPTKQTHKQMVDANENTNGEMD